MLSGQCLHSLRVVVLLSVLWPSGVSKHLEGKEEGSDSLLPDRLPEQPQKAIPQEDVTGTHRILAKLGQNKSPGRWSLLLLLLLWGHCPALVEDTQWAWFQQPVEQEAVRRKMCSKAPGFDKDGSRLSKHPERLSVSSSYSINDQDTGSPQSLSKTGS